jgi:hypothetical protein
MQKTGNPIHDCLGEEPLIEDCAIPASVRCLNNIQNGNVIDDRERRAPTVSVQDGVVSTLLIIHESNLHELSCRGVELQLHPCSEDETP